MSVQALGAVLDHSESTKGTRLTAISIANHADKNGISYPSIRLAAEEAKLSKRAAKNGIDTLRDTLGELVVLVEAEGKTHRPPLYWLNLPGLSGECGDDHPYFATFGPRSELVTDPGADSSPGGGAEDSPAPDADSAPHRVQEIQDPGASNDSPPYREPSKEPNNNPDDDSSGPLCNLLADLVAGNDPNGKRPSVTKAWLNAERLLLDPDHDGRDYDQAEQVIRWCQKNDFWRANVLSMPKFRAKYGALWLQASRELVDRQKADRSRPRDPDNPYDAGTKRSE